MASSGSSDLYTDVNSHPAQNLDDAPSQNIMNPCAATRSQSSEGSGHTGDLPLTGSYSGCVEKDTVFTSAQSLYVTILSAKP